MKVVYSKYIPPKNFTAINIFGFIFIRNEYKDILAKNIFLQQQLLNHEAIHTRQMKETLYIFFYLWYGLEWLIRWIAYGFNSTKAYKNLLFEREAYMNDHNFGYLELRLKYTWMKISNK